MTPKQLNFANNYAADPNAYQAAIDAGYSLHYAKTATLRLLKNEEVQSQIQRMRERLNQQADKSATDVVNEYAKIAFADRYEFLKDDPDFPGMMINKSPDELTPEQRALCTEIKPQYHTRKRTIEGEKIEVHRQEWHYRFSDKENALQQLGRHFGIFDDKLKLIGSQTNPFKNATPAQLEALRKSWTQTMVDPKLLEGEYHEVENG
jgi:phage terminase small subunit